MLFIWDVANHVIGQAYPNLDNSVDEGSVVLVSGNAGV